MAFEWTYSYHTQRAVIFDGPFIATEIICTVPYMTELLRHTTLEDIVAIGKPKLTPNELRPLFTETPRSA